MIAEKWSQLRSINIGVDKETHVHIYGMEYYGIFRKINTPRLNILTGDQISEKNNACSSSYFTPYFTLQDILSYNV